MPILTLGVQPCLCRLREKTPPSAPIDSLATLRKAALYLASSKSANHDMVIRFGRNAPQSAQIQGLLSLSKKMGFQSAGLEIGTSGNVERWGNLTRSGLTQVSFQFRNTPPTRGRPDETRDDIAALVKRFQLEGVDVAANFFLDTNSLPQVPLFVFSCLEKWGIRDIRIVFPRSERWLRYIDAAPPVREALRLHRKVGGEALKIIGLPESLDSEFGRQIQGCPYVPVPKKSIQIPHSRLKSIPTKGPPAPRRFHAICIGLPKTGTTSMAELFYYYRTFHEFQRDEMLQCAQDHAAGRTTRVEVSALLRHRDARKVLEMDSSCFHALFAGMIVHEFPAAKFVLTIRDCYSWANSFISMMIHRPQKEIAFRRRFCRIYLGLDYSAYFHDRKRLLLKLESGLIDPIFKAWGEINSSLLSALPPDRTLMLKTSEISSRVEDIARFIGISKQTLSNRLSHSNSQVQSEDWLAHVDGRRLRDTVQKHCGKLMRDMFPRELRQIESRAIACQNPRRR